MSRPLRIEFDGAWYHVMNRGQAQKDIFLHDDHRKKFLNLLEEACELYKIEVHAYCLMSNHYHLLIHTPKAGLSRSIRHINGIYTQYFNRTENRDGPLFRGRYKAILVEDDTYLLNVSRYIHLNPVSAKIVQRAEDYKWSSCNFYIDDKYEKSWVYTEEILSLMNGKSRNNRYLEFINEGVDMETLKFYDKKKQMCVYGSEKFVNAQLQKISKDKIEHSIPDYNASKKNPSIESIIDACCLYFQNERSQMLYPKPGATNIPRSVCIYLCKKIFKVSTNEIIFEFNCKHANSVSKSIYKVKKLFNESAEFESFVANIANHILTL